jgi:hypothetical protein
LSFTVSRDDERVPVFSGPYLPSVIGGPGLGVHRRRFHNNQTSTNSSTPKRGDIIPGSAAPKPLSGEVAGTSMQSVDVGGDAGKVIWEGRRRQLPIAVQRGGTAFIAVPRRTKARPIRLYSL